MPSRPSPAPVRVQVPAKVNLHLGVGAAREDGYHDLVNVFHAVDLVDEVDVHPAPALSLTTSGEGAETLPTDAGNLAWQAAVLLARHAGVEAAARLDVRKAIPVAGGMAGGSADAAAALLACARLWQLEVASTDLLSLAARLGSDVAFPLLGGTAVGTGRGELLTSVPTRGTLHWVFAISDAGISAGAAYARLDAMRADGSAPPPLGEPTALLDALAAGDLTRIAERLGNDLQPAALTIRPELAETLAAGARSGALAGLVSGSGPTCAFLCESAAAATVLAAELEAAGVCRTARPASGPVAGATVLDR